LLIVVVGGAAATKELIILSLSQSFCYRGTVNVSVMCPLKVYF